MREGLRRHRGEEIKTLGDGFLAVFDAPARAIRFAQEIQNRVRPLGLEVRTGLHTGEVERVKPCSRSAALRARRAPSALALVLALFSGQAALIALAPGLPDVAADLGVPRATAGQLRSVFGLIAGCAALAMAPLAGRLGLRDLIHFLLRGRDHHSRRRRLQCSSSSKAWRSLATSK